MESLRIESAKQLRKWQHRRVGHTVSIGGGTLTADNSRSANGGRGPDCRASSTRTWRVSSLPAPGTFHVTVNGARRNVASGGVAISGATVTLTLASAVIASDTVKVRYTKPSNNPLRDTVALNGRGEFHRQRA